MPRRTSLRKFPQRFLVGFSFAGEQIDLVRSIAEAVERRLGTGTVFFYEWFQHIVPGADADQFLQEIYAEKCQLVVLCVSGDYGRKAWTLAEHEVIRALQMQLREGDAPTGRFRVYPIRVGEGDVKGIPKNTIIAEVRRTPIKETAELIVARLDATETPTDVAPGRFIFLAECTPDREDPTEPVNRQRIKTLIERLGWSVLPAREYPAGAYQARLQEDLARSSAFVQLLGRYAWKREDLDRVQDDAAARQQLPRFVFRSADIDLAKVEPAHRDYLTRREVIVSSFDDFLIYLKGVLERLGETLNASTRNASDTDAPLVRVAIRSEDPEALWARAFKWIDEAGDILSHQLSPEESFEAKHDREPCQGFLLLCDDFAHEQGTDVLRSDLEQCRLLQMREKDAAKRQPVALVYCSPPDAKWPKLVRSRPVNFERKAVAPDEDVVPEVITRFFERVRRVPRG